MLDQIPGRDGDKAGRKATLRDKDRLGPFGKIAHDAARGDIFGQVQIMGPRRLGRLSHDGRQAVGRAIDHGKTPEPGQGRRKRLGILNGHRNLIDMIAADKGGKALLGLVNQQNLIVAGLDQQIQDRGADLSNPNDRNSVHGMTLQKPPIRLAAKTVTFNWHFADMIDNCRRLAEPIGRTDDGQCG